MPQSLHNSLSFLKSANQSSTSLDTSSSPSPRSRSGSILRAISLHPSSTNNQAPMTPLSRTNTNSSARFQFNEENTDLNFSSNPDDFEIKNPIGYGSSAIVYNATYKPRNMRVAIKMIDLDLFERNQIDELRRETALMGLSKHPNVLKVFGSFVSGSKLYIATPYLSGGSCLDIMKNGFKDGFEEIVIATILKQALEGLVYLHKNTHIHRDVKAGNLLMDDQGTVLLADFGVSSSLTENNEVRKTFVGTPCWMAPEVMEQSGYNFKADIWSFGITAIELATGHAPFAKFPPMKVLMMTLNQSPPTLDRNQTKYKYTRTFKEMIDACLSKDPNKRPTAEKLLLHPFFKQAKKKDYLIKTVLACVPPLDQRTHKKLGFKQVTIENTDQWDFDTSSNDDKVTSAPIQKQHISFGNLLSTTEQTSPTPPATTATNTTTRKSRFVIEETDKNERTISSQRSLSPHSAASYRENSLTDNENHNTWQSAMGLGLGISSNSSPTMSSSSSATQPQEQQQQQQVRKGRFSVNQQSAPASLRTSNMPLDSSSPQSATTTTTTTTTLPPEEVVGSIPMSRLTSTDSVKGERKSRFEVQHLSTDMGAPLPISNTSHEQVRYEPPPSFQHRRSLSRESVGSSRLSRFSIEKEEPNELLIHPFETTTTKPTPTSNNAAVQSVSPEFRKKGRFELSTAVGERFEPSPHGTVHSNTTTTRSKPLAASPSSSSSDSAALVYGQMEVLLKQTEAQKSLIQDLMFGLSSQDSILPKSSNHSKSNSIDVRKLSNTSSTIEHSLLSTHPLEPRPMAVGNEIASTMDHLQQLLSDSNREKERLLQENEGLKREIDRLRKLQLPPIHHASNITS
ncbi:kinase-like domain-containing protein [Pilaira anomala]|nr:kinase-like domain-containing protein [Pilaira anomala]